MTIGEKITLAAGAGYGGGHIDFGVVDGTADETLSLAADASADVTAGAVSIVGDAVYLGNGSSADVIGAVDSSRSGSDGALRVNFVSPFQNPSFEEGDSVDGWTVIQDRVDLGTTKIAGYTALDQSDYSKLKSSNSWSSAPTNDDRAPAGARYDVKLNSRVASSGTRSLELTSSMTTAGACDVVHGPAVYSDSFAASANDKIYFDWRAYQGDDNFHVYGYILNTETGEQTPVLNATGGNEVNAFVTKETVIPSTGTYRFVFVGGTHDLTCGQAAGATLLIDNVRVYGTRVDDAVVSSLANKLRYANASDDPDTTRTIEISAVDSTGDASATAHVNVAITPVDDAPVFAPVSAVTLTNAEGAQTYAVTTGTLDVVDPDSPVTASIVGGAVAAKTIDGVSYDQALEGDYGTLYLEGASGRYAFVPEARAVDARQSDDSEAFTLEISAADRSPAAGAAKTARQSLRVNVAIAQSAPGAPADTAAAAGYERAELTWNAPSWTAGTPVTGYAIQQSVDGGTTWTTAVADTGTTATSRTLPGLDAGTLVAFRVAALNTYGRSAWGASSSEVTPFTTPGAPEDASVVPGDENVTVTWDAPASDGWSPITGYQIEQSADGGSTWAKVAAESDSAFTGLRAFVTAAVVPIPRAVPATTRTIEGLENGTALAFRVTALNVAGTGPAADAGTATPRTVPLAVQALTATPADREVTLQWTAPASDGGSPITGYSIEQSTDGGTTWTSVIADTGTTDTTATLTGLTNGSRADFRVQPLNEAGAGAAAVVGTTPRRAADAVTIDGIVASNRTLTVTFTAPDDDGGSPITGYEYSIDGGKTWLTVPGAASPLVIEGLINGTDYSVQVRAVTAAGAGEASTATTGAPVLAPVTNAGGGIPNLASGQGTSTLAGQTEKTATHTDGGSWSVVGDDFALTVEGLDADGARQPLVDGAVVVPLSGALRVRGEGYQPGSVVDLWLLPESVSLGEVETAADGTFEVLVPLPDGTAVGARTLQVNGLDPAGHLRSVAVGMSVVADYVAAPVVSVPDDDDEAAAPAPAVSDPADPEAASELPVTGGAPGVLGGMLLAVALLVSGAGALVVARKHRHAGRTRA